MPHFWTCPLCQKKVDQQHASCPTPGCGLEREGKARQAIIQAEAEGRIKRRGKGWVLVRNDTLYTRAGHFDPATLNEPRRPAAELARRTRIDNLHPAFWYGICGTRTRRLRRRRRRR